MAELTQQAAQHWRLEEYVVDPTPLGSGSFSQVFPARDASGAAVALKLDTSKIISGRRRRAMVAFEAAVLRELAGVPGVPTVFWQGTAQPPGGEKPLPAIILPRLQCTLTEWLRGLRGRGAALSMRQSACMAVEILRVVAAVHGRRYLHRDIKPDNIMLGPGPARATYLVDFGLAKKYVDEKGAHIPFTDRKGNLVGTPRYCSTFTHEHIESSRRDDLQSVLFVFLSVYFDRLPWQKTRRCQITEADVVRYKRDFLLGGSRDERYDRWLRQFPQDFFHVSRYVYNLGFEEEPNYDFIRTGMLRAFAPGTAPAAAQKCDPPPEQTDTTPRE
jgi:serine/threonine protein kinase